MQMIEEIGITGWEEAAPRVTEALEAGKVVLAPHLHFELAEPERRFLSPACLDGKSKNVSYRPATGALGGASPDADRAALTAMLKRYFERASTLLGALCPEYRGKLSPGFTSFRPAEIAGRATSWRKDDTRLHVDAFPSRPNHGERILRVFANVNPRGEPRVWRVGEPFEALARRFMPQLSTPLRGSAARLAALRITKSRRSRYDHYMLELHDRMKADPDYQKHAPQETIAFPPGCTWICFSDQTSHAALSGQYLFEQTVHLPVAGMYDPARSPLRVLERLAGRALV